MAAGRAVHILLTAALLLAFVLPATAQPLLTVELEQVLSNSEYGKAVLAEEAAQVELLKQRGREVDSQFETEELHLTEMRTTMEPAEFRLLADAFDAKVVATRAELQQLGRTLEQQNQARRQAFFSDVTPVLVQLLEETGATAIVEHRSLLVARQDLNITAEVIKRLDQAYRDRQAAVPEQPAPDEDNKD